MKYTLVLLAFAAGCSAETVRYDGDPVGPELPPLPPEHIMRRYPDFRFTDSATGKEFFLRFYSDELIQEEIVTVRDPGQAERSTTSDERQFALSKFASEWKSKGDEEKLRYHRELYEKEGRWNASLIDPMILFQEAEIRTFQDRRDATLFNLRARKDTNINPKEGDEILTKFHEPTTEFLEQELARLELEIKAAEAKLEMLRYKRTHLQR